MPIADDRDAVLFRFQLDHARPRAEDVEDWVERHPEHADDIRGHAEQLLAMHQNPPEETEASPALVARARDRALAKLAAVRAAAVATRLDLAAMVAAAGTTVPALARALDIGRPTLTDVVQGRTAGPLGGRLVSALAAALGATADAVRAAAVLSAAAPRAGHARAGGTPTAVARRFDEVVRDDPTMTDERKAHWLAEG